MSIINSKEMEEEKLNFERDLMDNLHNSYLFDPVQVASPGYVNEVNSCKADDGGPGKAKAQGKQSGDAPVHKEELRGEAPGAGSALNGVGPASAPAPAPAPQRGPRKQRSVSRASPEPQVAGDADPRAEGPAAEEPEPEPAPAPRLPPPDYPAPQGCAVRPGGAGRGHPPAGGRGLRTPSAPETGWDAADEPVATDVLRLYLRDAGAAPGAGSGGGWEDAPEDAAVAEALAALEAATAGEDVDEAD